MKKYQVIVIGAGSGLDIASGAAGQGLKTALIEPGPLGGTCLNRGCIPSKMLIHSADVVEVINTAKTFGVNAKGYTVDFKKLVTRVTHEVDGDARNIEKAVRSAKNYDLYKTHGRFVGPKTLQAGKETIWGEKIFIAAGTRPSTPPIPGLKDTPYLTSKEALRLTKLPKTLAIIGGGYIGCELAHFYGSLGTTVTIFQRSDLLLGREDGEVARRFTDLFSKKHNVLLTSSTTRVEYKNKKFTIWGEDSKKKTIKVVAEQLLVATGRVPNTDTLNVAAAGVKTSKAGYVQVNKYLETSAPGVWAIGDIAGVYFFKHSANLEAESAYLNAFEPSRKKKVDYSAMPHAVFTSPQIAGVGQTEEELIEAKKPYAKGAYEYINTGMGAAIDEKHGFVKVLCDPKTRKILGCHILGHDASTLIHEAIVVMRAGLKVDAITDAVHVHPALPEVLQRACGTIEWP